MTESASGIIMQLDSTSSVSVLLSLKNFALLTVLHLVMVHSCYMYEQFDACLFISDSYYFSFEKKVINSFGHHDRYLVMSQ